MKRVLSLALATLLLSTGVEAGMSWKAYTQIKSKSSARMIDVLEFAGPPDLTRESPLSNTVYLYYLGRDMRSDQMPTTVVIDGACDCVMSIERSH